MTQTGTVRIGISGWTYPPWRGVFYPKGCRRRANWTTPPASSTRWRSTARSTACSGPMPLPTGRTARLRASSTRSRPPLHHAHAEAAQCRDTAGQLRCLRSAAAGCEAGADPVAVSSAVSASMPRGSRRSCSCCRTTPRRRPPRPQARPPPEGAGLARSRHEPEDFATRWRSATTAFATARSSTCCAKYDVALVCADTVEWPRLMDLTSDFVYCRLHGSEELYASGYDDDALDAWASRVVSWATGGEPADAERVGGKAASARATCLSISTMTRRCARRSMRRALRERVDRLMATRSRSPTSPARAARTSGSSRSRSSAARGTRSSSAP